jgi:hypothetical protein
VEKATSTGEVIERFIKYFEGKSTEEIIEGTKGDTFVENCIKLTGHEPSYIGGGIQWVVIWKTFNRHFGLRDTGLY